MTIENGYTQTIEAMRKTLAEREDFINALMDDNATKDKLITHLTESLMEERREIKRIRTKMDLAAKSAIDLVTRL